MNESIILWYFALQSEIRASECLVLGACCCSSKAGLLQFKGWITEQLKQTYCVLTTARDNSTDFVTPHIKETSSR